MLKLTIFQCVILHSEQLYNVAGCSRSSVNERSFDVKLRSSRNVSAVWGLKMSLIQACQGRVERQHTIVLDQNMRQVPHDLHAFASILPMRSRGGGDIRATSRSPQNKSGNFHVTLLFDPLAQHCAINKDNSNCKKLYA